MRTGKWLVLLAVMVISLGMLWWFTERNAGETSLSEGELFLADMDWERQLERLDQVVIFGKGGLENLVQLRYDPDADTWVVPQRNNFPADVNRLSNFLTELSQLKKEEAKTARPELLHLLGLGDPQDGGEGRRLFLQAEDKEIILDLVLGFESNTRAGFFVRRGSEPQAWLVSPPLEYLPEDASGWLQQPLFNIAAERIAEIRIRQADNDYRLHRQSGSEVLQAELPEGFIVDEEYNLAEKAALLEEFNFDDLQQIDSTTFTVSFDSVVRVSTFDGLQITFEIDSETPLGPLMKLSATPSAEDPQADIDIVEEAANLSGLAAGYYFLFSELELERFDAESMLALPDEPELDNVEPLDIAP